MNKKEIDQKIDNYISFTMKGFLMLDKKINIENIWNIYYNITGYLEALHDTELLEFIDYMDYFDKIENFLYYTIND